MDVMTDAESSVQRLVEEYRAGFAAVDPARLIGIWDRDHEGLIYVAQERAEPMYGWPAIEAYYTALPTVIPVDEVTEMRVDDVRIDVHGDVAVAFCNFHFSGARAGGGESFSADGRVTFVCRQRAGRWSVIHYHESAPPKQ